MPVAARLAALAVGVSALGVAACGGGGGTRTITVRTPREGAAPARPPAPAASTRVIRRGKIAEWRRAPDEPGDADEMRSAAPSV